MNIKDLQEFVPCPLCEGNKKRGHMVCHNCHKLYIEEVADMVMAGEEAPAKESWAVKKLRARLVDLEMAVIKLERERDVCKEQKSGLLNELVREQTRGKFLHPDIATRIRAKIDEKEGRGLWSEVGGHRVVRDLRIAEARLAEAKRILSKADEPPEETKAEVKPKEVKAEKPEKVKTKKAEAKKKDKKAEAKKKDKKVKAEKPKTKKEKK